MIRTNSDFCSQVTFYNKSFNKSSLTLLRVGTMPESVHRRIVSELDMNSMRRISDALLLAQNRARRATDRTNQSEQFV